MSKEYPSGWEILYSKEEIERATVDLVEELMKVDGIAEKSVVLIQILESARVFAEAIKRGLADKGISAKVESIDADSYGGKPGERGTLKLSGLENIKLSGETILFVVDDMVDSGTTMEKTIEQITAIIEGSEIFSVVLLQKICSTFVPDFSAIKNCPNRWVAGHGINGNSPEELGAADGRDLLDIIARLQVPTYTA